MEYKIHLLAITSILAFALIIAAGMSITAFGSVSPPLQKEDDGNGEPPETLQCQPGRHVDPTTQQCVPDETKITCPPGQLFDQTLKQCITDKPIINDSLPGPEPLV